MGPGGTGPGQHPDGQRSKAAGMVWCLLGQSTGPSAVSSFMTGPRGPDGAGPWQGRGDGQAAWR